jgi:hypothetical protein
MRVLGGRVRSSLGKKFVLTAVVALLFTTLVGTGVAHAALTFSVSPSTGLADPDSVTVHIAGINAIPLATVEISECGNAYADGTPLATSNPSTDCQIVDRIDVSNAVTGTVDKSEPVVQSGIGTGYRSCVSAGIFSCDMRISHSVNQMGTPPPPVPISFAGPPSDSTPIATTTTASIRGGSPIVGGPIHIQVTVATSNPQLRAEGNVSVDIDSDIAVTSGTLGSDGTVIVTAPAYPHGPHSLVVHFGGNGSFAASDSPTTPFSVINADNVSIGDVSVVEGNSGLRTIYFPVVLSQIIPKTTTQIGWTFHAGTADTSDVSIAASGKLGFVPGTANAVVNYVKANVIGDTNPEPNEQFYIDLSLIPTKSHDFEIRRGRGTGTIIDDDTNPIGPAVSVGDASIQEGDTGGGHYVKLPLTLSDPNVNTVSVVVQFSSDNAKHLSRSQGGDWIGGLKRTVNFLPGVLRKNLGILEYPDYLDEPDLTIRAQIVSVTVANGGAPLAITPHIGVATILSDE